MYSIQFLSNKDFDSLPESETKGSDVSDSLGFYNPDSEKVYIRWTQSKELNKYLLNHEFDHILEEEATDQDENGIRHKKGPKFFKDIFFPGLKGAITGALVGGPAGAVIGGGAGAINGGINGPQQRADANALSDSQSQQSQPFDLMSLFGTSMAGSQAGGMSGGQSAGYSTYGGAQDSSQGSLNMGLNQGSSDNPFASDQQRFKYGAPAGRLQGF